MILKIKNLINKLKNKKNNLLIMIKSYKIIYNKFKKRLIKIKNLIFKLHL